MGLGMTALMANRYGTQFPGNNYLPNAALPAICILILCFFGTRLLYPHKAYPQQLITHLLIYFLLVAAIAYATNGIQYTPYHTVDTQIIHFEASLNIELTTIMNWAQTSPFFIKLMTLAYNSLNYQLILIPLVAIALFVSSAEGQRRLFFFYSCMLWTAFIGFSIYYFWPTSAPASNMMSSWFLPAQYSTGQKFYDIHHYITPSTKAGGMIAFPSFHAIWALLCLYLVWPYPLVFLLLGGCNSVLILACVFLGWHYPTDILGAFAVVALAFALQGYFWRIDAKPKTL